MKKFLFIICFLATSIIAYAQKDGDLATNWSAWQKAAPCFPHLYISYKSCGWVSSVSKWCYNFKLKNTGTKYLHFNLDIRFSSGEDYTVDGRFDLAPGKELTHVSMYYDTKPIPNAVGFFTSTVTKYLENDGSDDWAVVSYSCNGSTPFCDANCSSTSSPGANGSSNNQNGNNSNPVNDMKEINDEIKDLQYRQAVACGKLEKRGQPFNNKLCTEGYNGALPQNDADTKKWLLQLRRQVKELEAITGKPASSGNEDAGNNESNAAQEQQQRFDQLMTEGNVNLNTNNYDAAINNFNDAITAAPNAGDKASAAQALKNAQQLKADAVRKERVAAKQQTEKQQNEATVAAAASIVGAMSLIKDRVTYNFFGAKFLLGLGYGAIPIISNSVLNQKSHTQITRQVLFDAGFKLTLGNNKGISFQIRPDLTLGVSAFQTGIDGSSFQYGGSGTLFLATKQASHIKLFAAGGYYKRTLNYNYDQAVAEGANSTSDNVENAKYEYSMLRAGVGVMLHFIDDDKETFIKPGLFLEKPSFVTENEKYVMVANLEFNISSAIVLDASYSKNYAIAGITNFPYNFDSKNQNFWTIKLIRQGALK